MKTLLRRLGFHIHDWGKWEICTATYANGTESHKQARQCKDCGLRQIKGFW